MDSEHWFAPMASNTPATPGETFQQLFLSTGSTIPVNVKIYSGNKLLGNATVKKGEPTFFYQIPRNQMIIEKDEEKMKVLSKGLHLIGDGRFFANYRFSQPQDAEMVTSKGRNALGKIFYLGMHKGKMRSNNNIAAIIATEDNTTVTLSNYEPTLRFTNDSNPGSSTKTVKLNKGESYIYEVDNTKYLNVDFDGLIGAKVESDKPIAVTCGNFLGSVSKGRDYFTDIFMDQVLPVEKIGTEYIVMSGFGNMAKPSAMEKTLVVASEDNTAVFLNNNTSGIPDFVLPKAGSFQFVKGSSYQPADPANNIYSLYLKTSKPAYVYQIFAGDAENDIDTGSMNLIPPLSCLIPNKVDEISAVDESLVTNIFGGIPNTVKLNIFTQKGADVLVNNSKANISGPFPVPGTTEWEIYTYPNATGNITVSTTNKRSVTVGIMGGNYGIGYGGYFAGFTVEPIITSVGLCDDFKYLEVQDDYDEYEWYYSDDLINWILLPETSHQLDPQGKYGYYKCKVIKHFCSEYLFSDVFLYDKCPVIGPPQEFELSFCESLSPPITPVFSKFPSLPVDPAKTKIITGPQEGKAYVDSAGNIRFEADNTTLDKVSFVYYFEGYGKFADSEEVTVTVIIHQMAINNVELFECTDEDGYAIYNLKKFELENTDPAIIKFQYYEDEKLTKEIDPSNLSNYKGRANTTIYVKASNSSGCFRIGEIHLKTYTPPIITIQVNGKTAVITAEGGVPPYEYAVENSTGFIGYQSSNIFTNLTIGLNTAYVLSSDKCTMAAQDFMITQLPNVITPNDDGYNDILNYSEMKTKNHFSLKIFDRFGSKVFESSDRDYIWNGKNNGKPLPTGTYWYVIQWEEPKNGQTYQGTSFLLIKNR